MVANIKFPERLFPRLTGIVDPRVEREVTISIQRIYDYFDLKIQNLTEELQQLVSTQVGFARETSELVGDFATKLIGDPSSPNPLATLGSGTVTSVNASGNAVFSVSGGPITVSGTFSFTLNNQDANKVLAGPTSGGAAVPTFRLLEKGDINFPFELTTETSTDPTTTEYPNDGDWGTHRNTTSGDVFVAFNDGGAIIKVQLV